MSGLSAQQAQRFVSNWINKNGFSSVCEINIGYLLAETRRSRNILHKYGIIPFSRSSNRRVAYQLGDLQQLCEEVLRPMLKIKLDVKLAKATAITKGLGYYAV